MSYTPFIAGFLQPGEKVSGRPVDLVVDREGGLLVSDDYAGLIYRVVYRGAEQAGQTNQGGEKN